jgi:hypothetical protein
MYLVLPLITNASCSPHDVANKLLIWCLTIITHPAPYEILGDVYFVVLGICVETWLRLMTFNKKKYFKDLKKMCSALALQLYACYFCIL